MPTGQAEQGSRPVAEKRPCVQRVRQREEEFEPTTAVVWPVGQAEQERAREAVEYCPIGHGVQGE